MFALFDIFMKILNYFNIPTFINQPMEVGTYSIVYYVKYCI